MNESAPSIFRKIFYFCFTLLLFSDLSLSLQASATESCLQQAFYSALLKSTSKIGQFNDIDVRLEKEHKLVLYGRPEGLNAPVNLGQIEFQWADSERKDHLIDPLIVVDPQYRNNGLQNFLYQALIKKFPTIKKMTSEFAGTNKAVLLKNLEALLKPYGIGLDDFVKLPLAQKRPILEKAIENTPLQKACKKIGFSLCLGPNSLDIYDEGLVRVIKIEHCR